MTDFDDSRVLCPDDTCIGLIGADGRCKECGAIAEDADELPTGAASAELDQAHDADATEDSGTDADADDGDEASLEPDIEPARARPSEHAGFDADDRDLCPDGACIGLVGDDGRCKECGRDARAA